MLVLFFPRAQGANHAHLAAAGLADLASDRTPSWLDFRGPEGVGGMLCYWGDTLPEADASRYDWSRPLTPSSAPTDCKLQNANRPGCLRRNAVQIDAQADDSLISDPSSLIYRIGRLRGAPVTPQSLARCQKQPGRELSLADGQAWTIPVARQLPRVLGLDDQGDWTGVIDPKFERFWNQSWRMLSELAVSDDGQARVSWRETIDFAASALAVNFRVNREIVSFLGLLRTDLIWPLIQIVVEFESITAALSQKKTADPASESPASSAGAAA